MCIIKSTIQINLYISLENLIQIAHLLDSAEKKFC